MQIKLSLRQWTLSTLVFGGVLLALASVDARVRERVSDDFFGIGGLADGRAGERERQAAVPVVQLAEGALVATRGPRDQVRVRGIDPRRVSRHILGKMAAQQTPWVKLLCRWSGRKRTEPWEVQVDCPVSIEQRCLRHEVVGMLRRSAAESPSGIRLSVITPLLDTLSP